MTPELRIPRKGLPYVLFALAVLVVVGTLYGQRRMGESSERAALTLLQRRVLDASSNALLPLEWSAEDRERVEAGMLPDATLDAHEAAVTLYALRGRIDEGIGAYRRALSARPTEPALLFGLGSLMLSAARFEEARGLLQSALAREPGLWQASLRLSACLASEGQLADALALCRQILRVGGEPQDQRLARAYGNASLFELRLGRAAEALESANRAVSIERRLGQLGLRRLDLAQDLAVRAGAYLALQSPREALADLHEAEALAEAVGARALLVEVVYAEAEAEESFGQQAMADIHRHRVATLLAQFVDETRLQRALTLPAPVSRSGPG
jgi:tetratricopeptide (TPR) repeat protein